MPTEEKRREVEEYLALCQSRLWSAIYWVLLTVGPAALFVIWLLLFGTNSYWLYRLWRTIHWPVRLLEWTSVAVVVGSPITLQFLAETAKADLEKAPKRRPFADWLRDRAHGTPWRRLVLDETIFILCVVFGIWLLRPMSDSVILPPKANPYFLYLGLLLIIIGAPMASIRLWQIKAKREGDRTTG